MQKWLPIIVTIIIAAPVGFYGGYQYSQNKIPSGNNTFQDFRNLTPEEQKQRAQDFGPGARGVRNIVGFLGGEIISKDDKSITIKLPDGGSKIVFLSNATEIMKSADGTPDDLVVGENVIVNGSTNSDGSITAQNIQTRPQIINN
ncbi:MAG: DUF5666 domain-containing protein [Patescibacteria group bacterium]